MDEKLKKIVFYDTSKKHADLKIRLHYDGLTQSSFFRALVSAYIEREERIIDFIEEYKIKNKTQSKRKIKESRKIENERKENKNKFGLEEEEIEDIFDILEKEHPEL